MTARQFYIMLWITTISLKVQKLPSIIYDGLGKDGYLLLLAYFVIDVIGIVLAFFILKKLKQNSLAPQTTSTFLNVLKKVLVFVVVVYFLAQGLLLYESIQNLFEHILFDNLSWKVFSLLLIFAVFYLANTGIKNMARNFELYAVVIFVSYVIIAIFGATKADFTTVFPFQTINVNKILDKFVDFNLWFGDFFLILFMGNHARKIKLKWSLVVYSFAISFLLLLYIELNGIYGVYTSMKPSLITTITEQSMLGLNIGRVDWFLILFTEIGTILSCAVCIYFASKCLKFIFPKVKRTYLLIIVMLALYLINVYYLQDTHMREVIFTGYMSYVSAFAKWGSFLLMLLACVLKNNKKNIKEMHKKNNKNKNMLSKNNAKGSEACYGK